MRKRGAVWCTTLAAALVACGGAENGSDRAAANGSSDAGATVEERTFAEGVGDDKCAVLTLQDVAEATGVPAAEIRQQRVSGCLYSWDDGSVWVSSVRVRDSVEGAKRYFARYTEDVTAEQVSEAKERFQDELKTREESGEMTSTEGAAGRALTESMPEMDFRHQRLPGVGSEAVYDGHGGVHIRWGNLLADFSGKTNGEDAMDPELATAYGRRIVANLGGM